MPTIEITSGPSGLMSFLRELLEQQRDDSGLTPDERAGGEAPHEDEQCECSGCRLSRYEMPLPLEGKELKLCTLELIQMVHETAGNSQKAGGSTTIDLVNQPLSPELERVMLQYRCDRLEACVRAEHALAALMPENLRPPTAAMTKSLTIEGALTTLEKARAQVAKRLADRKAAADIVEESVKEASAAEPEPEPGATPVV